MNNKQTITIQSYFSSHIFHECDICYVYVYFNIVDTKKPENMSDRKRLQQLEFWFRENNVKFVPIFNTSIVLLFRSATA